MGSAWGKFRIPPQVCFQNENSGAQIHLNRIGNGYQRDVFEVIGDPHWIAKLEVSPAPRADGTVVDEKGDPW
eukprot:12906408-Prorocentrum_lima.AAC.1